MKGLDALAKTCAPETPEAQPTPASVQLSADQIKQIADAVISQLQTPAPDKTPEPDPEPEEGGNENGDDERTTD